jgi:hypothetical protein
LTENPIRDDLNLNIGSHKFSPKTIIEAFENDFNGQ